MEKKRKKLVHVNLKDLGFKEIEGLSEYSNKLLVEEDVDIKEYAKNETAPYGGEDFGMERVDALAHPQRHGRLSL